MPVPSSCKAAFFDIDGTLVKGFIICAFPVYLAKRGFFDKGANGGIKKNLRLYKTGKASYREISLRIPNLYAAGLRGQKQEKIRELASDFMRGYRKNILPYSKELVSLMNKNGFFTIAISGAPVEAIAALDMDFKEIHGSEMWVRKGVYTGRIRRNLNIAEGKKKVVKSLIRRYGIDLKGSFAFGDTEQDLAMLSRVGNPLPLNPTPLLREYAVKKGWRIPRDVIREVKNWF